jgi:quinol-cytochrome oxidoreductase complex cytochrome b subunit
MLMRNLHRAGTQLLIALGCFHLIFAIAFRVSGRLANGSGHPSGARWLSGAALVAAVSALVVTGYFFPSDQFSAWAVMAGTRIARTKPLISHDGPFGELIGVSPRDDARTIASAGPIWSGSFARFFIIHACMLPLVGIVAFVLHFIRRVPRRA